MIRIEEDTSDADLDRYHDLGVRAIRLDLFAHKILADRGHHRLCAADGGAGRAPRLAHPVLHTPAPSCVTCCRSWPTWRIPFVIDHMGYMLEADGLTQADSDGRLLGVLGLGQLLDQAVRSRTGSPNSRPLSSVGPLGPRAGCPPGPTG